MTDVENGEGEKAKRFVNCIVKSYRMGLFVILQGEACNVYEIVLVEKNHHLKFSARCMALKIITF